MATSAPQIEPLAVSASLDKALASYMATLDFAKGRDITETTHHQGEVRLFAPNDPNLPAQLIIKRPKGRGLRRWLALQTLKREHHAYQRLAGVSGVARCFGLYRQQYLVLEHVEGQPLVSDPKPSPEFFQALLTTIETMHAQGVAHGDLKKKDNIVVNQSNQPVILDFGTAVVKPAGWHPIRAFLFEFIRRTDLNAWVKHKYGGYTQVASEDRVYLNRSFIERVLTQWRSRNR